jgi:predicted outer membrane repeat protein
MTGCTIADNSTNGPGGGVYFWDSLDGTFDYCIFAGNTALGQGGGFYCTDDAAPSLSHCTFYGNSGSDAGGISCTDASSLDVQNTVVSFSTGGQAVACDGGSSAELTCCDVYGNAGGDWVGCIAGQDTIAIRFNISEDPLFCQPESLDFTLDSLSICFYDTECGLIGALEAGCAGASSVEMSPSETLRFGLLANRPNPFSPSTRLVFTLPEKARVVLTIHDATGRRVAVLTDRRYGAGVHHVTWNGRHESDSSVSPGVYFCHLDAGDHSARQKIVLVR